MSENSGVSASGLNNASLPSTLIDSVDSGEDIGDISQLKMGLSKTRVIVPMLFLHWPLRNC